MNKIARILVSVFVMIGEAFAQEHFDYEQQAMQMMAHLGRPEVAISSVQRDETLIKFRFSDKGLLMVTRSPRKTWSYSNVAEWRGATARSRSESPTLSTAQAEERAWRLLPQQESREAWRVKTRRDPQPGEWEQSGVYSFTMEKLHDGVPIIGAHFSVTIDAYTGKVLSYIGTELAVDSALPPAHVISADEARSLAVGALDRIESATTRNQIREAWTSNPPSASQIYVRPGPGGPHSEAVVSSWPARQRLIWSFSGSGADVGVDAETGAILFVSLSKSVGAMKSNVAPTSNPALARENRSAPTEPHPAGWLWVLATLPVGAGMWWMARRVRLR